eukprot:5278578-Pyramimonas_sp.AAC.1
MMVDSGAHAAQPEAPEEQSSPTVVPSEEETAPAAEAPAPAAALSGSQAAEIPSAERNPDAEGTPGSLEAGTDSAQANVFPYDADP